MNRLGRTLFGFSSLNKQIDRIRREQQLKDSVSEIENRLTNEHNTAMTALKQSAAERYAALEKEKKEVRSLREFRTHARRLKNL